MIRPNGYYWVRYSGAIMIMEWLNYEDNDTPGVWLMMSYDGDIDDAAVEVLSEPLEPPVPIETN